MVAQHTEGVKIGVSLVIHIEEPANLPVFLLVLKLPEMPHFMCGEVKEHFLGVGKPGDAAQILTGQGPVDIPDYRENGLGGEADADQAPVRHFPGIPVPCCLGAFRSLHYFPGRLVQRGPDVLKEKSHLAPQAQMPAEIFDNTSHEGIVPIREIDKFEGGHECDFLLSARLHPETRSFLRFDEMEDRAAPADRNADFSQFALVWVAWLHITRPA